MQNKDICICICICILNLETTLNARVRQEKHIGNVDTMIQQDHMNTIIEAYKNTRARPQKQNHKTTIP